jgi:ATPase related to the helicase subunit of the Holliday junction resolvase
MSDLFATDNDDDPGAPSVQQGRPLADQLRPRSLDEVIGQEHLLGRYSACKRGR